MSIVTFGTTAISSKNMQEAITLPLLSIIIPIYNCVDFLEKTIESIIKQPCSSAFCVVIVDDGSSDGSGDLAERLKSKFSENKIKVIHQKNSGVSIARNTGLQLVTTPYVCFLDGDDVLCKGALDEDLYGVLLSEKYDVIRLAHAMGDERLLKGTVAHVKQGELLLDNAIRKVRERDVYLHSMLFRTQLLEGLSFPPGIRLSEDLAFNFLALGRCHRLLQLDRPWFIYRNNIDSVVHRKTRSPIDHSLQQQKAWHWCKSKCSDVADRIYCDNRIFLSAVEYAEVACEEGYDDEEVASLFESSACQEAVINLDLLWPVYRTKYKEYSINHTVFRRTRYRHAFIKRVLRKLNTYAIFHSIYLKMKHRESIHDLTY